MHLNPFEGQGQKQHNGTKRTASMPTKQIYSPRINLPFMLFQGLKTQR